MTTLHQAFEFQARHRPDQIAVRAGGQKWTYAELDRTANRLAHFLRRQGVCRGDLIPIVFSPSTAMIASMLAIMKCGAAYVPINSQVSSRRLLAMLQELSAPCILLEKELALPEWPEHLKAILWPNDNRLWLNEADDAPAVSIEPQQIAYMIYTSGTTGKPKGVLIPHEAVVTMLHATAALCQPWPEPFSGVSLTPYTFDVSVYELFSMLCHGGTLHLLGPNTKLNPKTLSRYLQVHRITSAYLPPGLLAPVITELERLSSPLSLRRLLVGVEPIKEGLLQRFRNLLPDADILNGYGPTETTICCTMYPFTASTQPDEVTPIGQPLFGYTIHLVDENMHAVRPGDTGEILIGGKGLATGYFNDDTLTAKKFIADPFSADGSGRLYRSGDLGRLRADGQLIFAGRIDRQIKLRGHRIELLEIESVLRQHPEIVEAAVVVQGAETDGMFLRAFFTSQPDQTPSLVKVRSFLEEWLPAYAVPAELSLLTEMPRDHNGKIDYRQLAAIKKVTEKAALSAVQQRVANIWKEMLQAETVQAQDHFFSLGGHSLNATQILSRIFQLFQIRLSLKSLMDNPTLETFCRLLPDQLPLTEANQAQPAVPETDGGQPVLTLTQEELWVLHQLDQNSNIRNIVIRADIHGPLQPSHWQSAFQSLIRHHQALHSIFVMAGSSVFHHVISSPHYFIEVKDLEGTAERPDRFLQREEERLGELVFNTARWPLFAARLYRLTPDHHVFLFSVHHLVFDGWSHNIFFDHLLIQYDAQSGRNGRSHHSGMSYFEACSLVRRQQSEPASDLAFWRRKLLPVPPRLNLPYRQSGRLQPSYRGERISFSLTPETVKRLENWTRQQNANLFSGLITLFKAMLYTLCRQTDLVIGTPHANRNHPDWENVIGYFTNMVSIRSQLSPPQTLNSYLRNEFRECIDALDHSTIPFGKLVQELKIGERRDFNPIYKIIFIMQKPDSSGFTSDTLSVHSREIGNHTAKIDLTVNVELEQGGIEGWLEYDTGLFETGAIREMAAEYVRWLEMAPGKGEMPLQVLADQSTSHLQDNHFLAHRKATSAKRLPVVAAEQPLRFMLIGETSLLVQCARLLQEKGYQILAVVSPDPLVLKWAQTENLPTHNTYARLHSFMQQYSFDFLLSIVNSAILSEEVLAMAAVASINYHDAPLPAYAGVYATSWAILNGERRHGVTWHMMTAVADEGDVVAQEIFELNPFDNVQMLNAQCYEAAIRTFRSLLQTIADGALLLETQDLRQRSYFGLYQRPEKGGVLDFSESSESLFNLIRSVGFGASYQNPFSSAKLLIDNKVYLVKSAATGGQRPGSRPGEILDITADTLVVAAATGAVQIQALTDLYGQAVTIPFLQKHHQLHPGRVLTTPAGADLVAWGQRTSDLARHEKYWFKELMHLPAADAPSSASTPVEPWSKQENFSSAIQKRMAEEGPGFWPAAIALFNRCLDPDSGPIGLVHQATLVPEWAEFDLAAAVVPLNLDFTAETDLDRLRQAGQQVEKAVSRKTFLLDLYSRYPELQGKKPFPYSIIVVLADVSSLPEKISQTHPQAIIVRLTSSGLQVRAASERRQEVQQYLSRLLLFIEHICSHGFERLQQLPLLLPAEEALLQAELAKANPFALQPVPFLFASQVQKTPHHIAVQQEGQSLTYLELNQLCDRIAARLQREGTGANRCVGLCMQRSPGLIAAVLAIQKCGCSYVPMDAKYPRHRIAQIIADADIKQIIVTRELAGLFDGELATTLIFEEIQEEAPAEQAVTCTLDDRAYVIFTSGSTGKPKGVMIGHQALAQFTLDAIERYGLGPSERVLQFASISFDAAVEEIFPALCSGATLVLRTDEWLSSIPNFIRECNHAGITVLDLPTAFWNVMIHECSTMELALPASVRCVIIGGELATDAAFASWKKLCGSYPLLFNTYGPTEATVVATHFQYQPDWPNAFLPIGRSRHGVHALVLNRFGQPLPPGYAGELYLAGSCLADGYINNEAMTRQAFQEKTVLDKTIRVYKTGDYVRQLQDGHLLFVGRKDDQVKIRGFRIELEEIKTAVSGLAEVKDCVVTTYGEGTDKKLAAYVVFSQAATAVDALRQQLRGKLPDYMMPAVFIPLDAIPLTVNMKADLRALPSPHTFEKKATLEGKQEIFSPVERTLQHIWQTVLEQAPIGADQDFFELGGDSLRAVRIMTMVEREMGRSLPISVLFRYATIRQLALLIESKDEEMRWRSLVQIKEGHGKLPLFIIHGAGLNILLFNTLARHMDADQPIYGLQARHMNGQGQPLDNLDEIVHEYAQEMLNVLPNGPFALAGFSIGGLIAFELAHYFRRHHKKVAFLGVFDTFADSAGHRQTGVRARLGRLYHMVLKIWFNARITVRYPAEVIPKKWRWLRYRMRLKRNRAAQLKDQELMNLPEKLQVIAAAIISAVEKNQLEWYPGPLHLFRAERRLFYVPETEYLGWKKYVPDVIVHRIPGDHSYIFAPPNDMVFAQVLQAALDEETRRLESDVATARRHSESSVLP